MAPKHSTTDTHERATRRRRLVTTAAVPGGVLLSGLLVLAASHSAFSAQTNAGGDTWSTGQVTLTNDHTSSAVFQNTAGLLPGQTETQDVVVSYTGSAAVNIDMYATATDEGPDLAGYIDLTISDGTNTWTGTLADLEAKTYSDGVLTWAASSSKSETFTITYTLSSDTPNELQGATTGAKFTWEAQTAS